MFFLVIENTNHFGEVRSVDYLIKNEACVVRDHVWHENSSVSNLNDSFEKLENWVGKSQHGHGEAVPIIWKINKILAYILLWYTKSPQINYP